MRTSEWNAALQAIATRQKHLHNLKIDDLRLMVSTDPEGRITPARTETAGMSKQDLVEQILYDEFHTQYDQDLPLNVETDDLDAKIMIEMRTERHSEDY